MKKRTEKDDDRLALSRAKTKRRRGYSATTAAGEFVREEIEHVREGKHGARSPEQAIAIGLSKARRAGIPLPPPPAGSSAGRARSGARSRARSKSRRPSRRRSKAAERALKREPRGTTSGAALSAHAKRAARRRRRSR
jgi:hypothetical protein